MLVVLPITVRGAPVAAPHRDPEGRGVGRAAYPRRFHVQGRGQRAVLPAARAAQDCREPTGLLDLLDLLPTVLSLASSETPQFS